MLIGLLKRQVGKSFVMKVGCKGLRTLLSCFEIEVIHISTGSLRLGVAGFVRVVVIGKKGSNFDNNAWSISIPFREKPTIDCGMDQLIYWLRVN